MRAMRRWRGALRRLAQQQSAGTTVEHDEGCIIHSPDGHAATSTCDATEAMVTATALKAGRAGVIVLCLGEEAQGFGVGLA